MFEELNQNIESKLVGPTQKKMLNLCVIVLLMNFHSNLFFKNYKGPLKDLSIFSIISFIAYMIF
jgi:hypothetical protein